MADNSGDVRNLAVVAAAVGALAIIDLMAIAVVTGFKNTGLVDNGTADKFITGLTVFATFTGVIVIALVGKIVISLFRKGM